MRVESYIDLSARTSRSDSEGAPFPRAGLFRGDPVRNDRELNFAARASGEGRMCQIGSNMDIILVTESFVLPARLEV